jgi:hypothetical protein
VFDVVCVGSLCVRTPTCLLVENRDVGRIVQNDSRGVLVSFGCFLYRDVRW